jgi:hypothetical protein
MNRHGLKITRRVLIVKVVLEFLSKMIIDVYASPYATELAGRTL